MMSVLPLCSSSSILSWPFSVFCLQINFRISLSTSTTFFLGFWLGKSQQTRKNTQQTRGELFNLIEKSYNAKTALKLWIRLGRTDILTILMLPIYEHLFSFYLISFIEVLSFPHTDLMHILFNLCIIFHFWGANIDDTVFSFRFYLLIVGI